MNVIPDVSVNASRVSVDQCDDSSLNQADHSEGRRRVPHHNTPAPSVTPQEVYPKPP